MREYGQVQCSFWSDPDIQGVTDTAKLLALYLLTGPHSNGLGCYRLPNGYVQADFGWSSERVSKGYAELFQIGFCNRCESTDFVLVPKFLRWNPVSNPKVAIAREKEFRTVPKKAAIYQQLAQFMVTYGGHWSEPFRNHIETVSKGYAKQDPTLPYPNLYVPPKGETHAPFSEIVALYHQHCPSLAQVAKLTPARQEQIRARWRNELPTLEQWAEYFEAVEASDFLTGRVPASGGRQTPWKADIDFLIKQGSVVKMAEGKYD